MELDITVEEIIGTDNHDDDNKKNPAKAAFINVINDITKDITKKRKSKWDCIQRCIDHQEGNIRTRVDADQNPREETM